MKASRSKSKIKVFVEEDTTCSAVFNTHADVGPSPDSVRLVRSFIAVLSNSPEKVVSAGSRLRCLEELKLTHIVSADKKAEVAFADAEPGAMNDWVPSGKITFIVGDEAEWEDTCGKSCMAHAACIKWDPIQGSISVLSSIVALPPVFICHLAGWTVLTTELYLLRAVANMRLTIDPQSALDLFRFGYPIEHRTLFNCVILMPGGYNLKVDAHGRVILKRSWTPPQPKRWKDQLAFVDFQTEAFRQAVKELDLSDSLFSLTGGLDTRAVLAVLSGLDIKPVACTISGGRTLCLDARLASALCKAYGLRHLRVDLGEKFVRDLPTYVVEASRLSGGLASLEQAHEVYFYRQIHGIGSKRLSGNLGNQVGRRGVEGISTRNADALVLNEDLRAAATLDAQKHWLASTDACCEKTLMQLLLEYEVPFSSVGNFSIGHHFRVQQTPYANLRLIETTLKSPLDCDLAFTQCRARIRDLCHRFIGPSRDRSFQCRVIRAAGGAVARYPINWGWRIKSGISLRGMMWGVMALADCASSAYGECPNFVRNVLSKVGALGINEIRQPRTWLDSNLREFVNDTLRSRSVVESNLFDAAALSRLLDEHYGGVKMHHGTLLAALDLALSHQIFAATSAQA